MNFLKRNIRVFLLGGFLFTALMGVTEALNIISVPQTTIDTAGGTIPFGVLWFVYEGLKILLVVWALRFMGVISFRIEESDVLSEKENLEKKKGEDQI